MEATTQPKNKLGQNQLDELNNRLENYKKLSPEIQAEVRRAVIE